MGTVKQWNEWGNKVLKNMSDAVIAADNKGAITLVNPAAENLTGRDTDDLTGKSLRRNIELFDIQSRNPIQLPTPNTFRGNPEPRIYSQCFFIEGNNKKEIPVEAVFSPVRGYRGSIAGAILVIRDRTKQVANDQFFLVNHKIEAIGSIAGSVARVFNNWIGVILAKASSIADNLTQRTKSHIDALAIIEAVENANTLSRRLLNIENTNRRSPDELKSISLGSLLTETVAMVKPDFKNRKVEIIVKKTEKMPPVKANPGQLTDCLMDLFLNAAESMPCNGGRIIVDFTEKQENGQAFCVLRLRDNGSGMKPEVLNHACEPFFTTKNTTQASGLGLTIVQATLKAWGGQIKIRSRSGQGTSVRLFLPLGEVLEKTKKEKVMPLAYIVDDNKEVLENTSSIVSNIGYNVSVFSCSRDCITSIKKNGKEVALFLVDVLMPEIDGKDVIEEIFAVNPSAKIVVMSGFSKDYIRSYLKHGLWDYIQKPFDEQQITSILAKNRETSTP